MVGGIFGGHRAFSVPFNMNQLGFKSTLNYVGKFIQNDVRGMQRVADQARAKIEAKQAVIEAIRNLEHDGVSRSRDLRYLDSIITKARGFASDEQFNNPDFRVALFDAAWNKSAGKGKLGILLKTKEGASRDGTKALKLDLRKAAKSDPDTLETATRLASQLESVKKCPTTEGSGDLLDAKALKDNVEALDDILGDYSAEFAFQDVGFSVDNLGEAISKAELSNFIGARLTKSLHPDVESALQAARQIKNIPVFEHESTLKLFQDHFGALSSPDILSINNLKGSPSEVYRLALSIAALKRFSGKVKFTQQDIALLKHLLKIGKMSADERKRDRKAHDEEKKILADFDKIKLDADPERVRFEMAKAVADYYLDTAVLSLSPEGKVSATASSAVASNSDAIIKVLEDAFAEASTSTHTDGKQFFEPLEDRAASWREQPTTLHATATNQILKVFDEFFDAVSLDEFWSDERVRPLFKYYGLAFNIVALEKLRGTKNFTKDDIAFLKSTLKDEAEQNKSILDKLDKIDLTDRDRAWFKMSEICARHYVEARMPNLSSESGKKAEISSRVSDFEKLQTADGIIGFLKSEIENALDSSKTDTALFLRPVEYVVVKTSVL